MGILFRSLGPLCSFFLFLNSSAAFESKVIYGDDHRKDLYQINDPKQLEWAQSTAALVFNSKIKVTPGNPIAEMKSKKFGEALELCSDEPFFEQPSVSFCSASLVGKDKILTAGHCISSATCSSVSVVFDYALQTATANSTEVPVENIFQCKKVLHRKLNYKDRSDWAIIQLDRPVKGRTPLSVRSDSRSLTPGHPLMVIGHPSGLPTKVAGGAQVRENKHAEYFMANLDTYAGNSGSAVFDALTGEVLGVLVNGAPDFVMDTVRKCRKSNQCSDTGCRGEGVSHASSIAPYLP